jgi:peptidoglycan/xylan/chitin deacetylase (PgdA/CDA1 family)
MKARQARGAGHWLLRVLSPAGRRARLQILTYHRVLPAPDPLLPDEPDAAAFAAQMAAVARYCRVLALPEAARRLADRTLPACAACITFDDGYGNNHEIARPILERLGLPATVFVAGDAVDRGVMWNDLVIEAIRRAQGRLDLGPAGLGTLSLPAAGPRAGIATQVLNAVKYRPLAERWTLAVDLYERNAGGPLPRFMMTRAQVKDLASRGFDVGSHTVTHPILATLPASQARAEIAGSWRWVLEVAGMAPRSFAYPNGRPGRDFDATHAAMVREAGFEIAVTTVWGSAKGGDDPLQLPRYAPWETSAGGLWRRLAKTTLRSYLS